MNKIIQLILFTLVPLFLVGQTYIGPDSIYHHPYQEVEGVFDVNPQNASYFTYDENGFVLESKVKQVDFFTGTFDYVIKYDYTYSSPGFTNTQTTHNWDTDAQDWKLSSISTTTFDDNNLFSSIKLENYNDYGEVFEVSLTNYTIENGALTMVNHFVGPNEDNLEPHSRQLLVLEDGNIIESINQNYDTSLGDYVNNRKATFDYDDNLQIANTSYNWDSKNEDWIPNFNTTFEYEGTNISTIINYNWYPDLMDWNPTSKTEFSDYESSQAGTTLNSYYDGYDWLLSNETIIEFTDKGQIDRINYNTYNVLNMAWTRSSYNQYYYSLLSDLSNTFSSEVSIYPNPSVDIFYINNQDKEPLQIQVFNTYGQQMESITTIFDNHTIDARNYPAGSYFIKIFDLENNTNKTLQVAKI